MKNTKITRKKYRLEALESAVENVENYIEVIEKELKNTKEALADASNDQSTDEWYIQNLQEKIENNTLRIEEAKKLLAEFEKMA